MPSRIKGFEYDIFISYRQNDNKYDSWVSLFIENLQRELTATIKGPVSVYFDENPQDGLLETHMVKKSLEGKLKCLIFIPIISQTYCDPKSYAWQHEFCSFNKSSQKDKFGRDIKLGDGNVASRIIPVKIHNIDNQDISLFEAEVGSALRSIDFIYRATGVNRPLRVNEDEPRKNLNHTFYRDQINKLANSIKQALLAIDHLETGKPIPLVEPNLDYQGTTLRDRPQEKTVDERPLEKSIAVLPFINRSNDPAQAYFADGIAENIIIRLATMKNIRVISRTSTLKFRDSILSSPEIAKELKVKYLMEGSAQSYGNKARIHVQLIDAIQDEHVWVKVFNETLEDILAIENDVAEKVADQLQASFLPAEKAKSTESGPTNPEAYDLFLKGRHAFNQWSVEGYREAENYFLQAIKLDPNFKEAYSYLASSYSGLMSWNGDMKPDEARKKIETYLDKVWELGPTDNDYLTRAFLEFFLSKDFKKAEKYFLKAIDLGPNNATVRFTYSYLLNMMGRHDEAMKWIAQAREIDPASISVYNYTGVTYYLQGNYNEAIQTFKEGIKLFPNTIREFDHLAKVHLAKKEYHEAYETVNKGLTIAKTRPPSMIGSSAMALLGMKKPSRAQTLVNELIERSKNDEKGADYVLAQVFSYFGDEKNAQQWIAKAEETNDIGLIWRHVDPLLADKKKDPSPTGLADFVKAESFIRNFLEENMPKDLPYHNPHHINDVLAASMEIAKAEKLAEEDTRVVKLAALWHDAGFSETYKGHEEAGCRLAREHLPVFGFTEDDIEVICGLIMATKIPQSPKTNLEKVLCDADLDYLGRSDFSEISERLFEEVKGRKMVKSKREWDLIQRTFIQNHKYHTLYSIEKREPLKLEHLDEINQRLAD